MKARIGLLPSTYLTEPVTGVWNGKVYEFALDFTNSSFNFVISDLLEVEGLFEIQVEYNGTSKTILQPALFRNSFLGSAVVNLVEPLEPSLVGGSVLLNLLPLVI